MSDGRSESGRTSPTARWRVETVSLGATAAEVGVRRDVLVTEEPLEIRLRQLGVAHPVAVTMRTPGDDFALAAGFLFSEGILDDPADVARIRYCSGGPAAARPTHNSVDVVVRDSVRLDTERVRRHFYAASSCGVCGKASIAAVDATVRGGVGEGPLVTAEGLLRMPDVLRERQKLFERTGGLHAAALFDASGVPLALFEDVGRHNALDKLVGNAWLAGAVPLAERIVVVSGRISFEVVQKCARAGIAFVAGVSAPSSLAVELADRFGMTLVGFLRRERFNLYCGRGRVAGLPAPSRRRD